MHRRDERGGHEGHDEHGNCAEGDEGHGFPGWLRGGQREGRCGEEGCAGEEEDGAYLYGADEGGFGGASVVDEEALRISWEWGG